MDTVLTGELVFTSLFDNNNINLTGLHLAGRGGGGEGVQGGGITPLLDVFRKCGSGLGTSAVCSTSYMYIVIFKGSITNILFTGFG